MSHFGRAGPPDIRDTYSLLVLNITFRTSADDLYPLFDRYGKVVDIFIPRDRRTQESRGFAFVRYKYADEAQKAIERLDGRAVDGRNIVVQSAKYGRNDEPIHRGRITDTTVKKSSRSRSQSPRRPSRDRRYRDEERQPSRDTRRRSRSRDRSERERYRGGERERESKGYNRGPERERERGGGHDSRRRGGSRSMSPSRSRSRDRAGGDEKRFARGGSDRPKGSPRASPSKGRSPRIKSPGGKRSMSRSLSRSMSRSPQKLAMSVKEVGNRSPVNTARGSESPDRKASPPRRRVSVSPKPRSRSPSPLQGSLSPGQPRRSRSLDVPRSSLSPVHSDGV